MSNIAYLQNVGGATKLPEGSVEELMKRVVNISEGLNEADKAKLDTALADAFTALSSTLDQIELDQAQTVVNRLQGAKKSGVGHGFKLPAGDDPSGVDRVNTSAFKLPRATV